MAGNVVRYHTWPVLIQQTNAHHTWNVLRIMVEIWPQTPQDILLHTIFHDGGELGPGDIPFPYKSQNPVLKKAVHDLEVQSLRDQGVWRLTTTRDDDDEWLHRAKTCDLIEMLEKGLEEYLLGNYYGWGVVEQIMSTLSVRQHPRPDDAVLVSQYITRRLERFEAIIIQGGKKSWSPVS